MNITDDIITDLFPLYVSGECSADTRALVEGYLREHPGVEQRLRRIMAVSLPAALARTLPSEELRSLRKTRRRLRVQATLCGFAIFFSLTPLSVWRLEGDTRTHWLMLEHPITAAIYAAIGVILWIAYALLRNHNRAL